MILRAKRRNGLTVIAMAQQGNKATGCDNLRIADLETDRNKLRQAVRDLTDSSEKLRAVNRAAVQKCLRLDSPSWHLFAAAIRPRLRLSVPAWSSPKN